MKKLYHKQSIMNALLATASGVMLALAFPRPGVYPLAWVALVPLLAAIRRVGPAAGFGLGFLTGLIFFSVLLYWIALFGYLPWAMLAVVEALFIACFALLANLAWRGRRFAILAVPALWTAIEWLRSLGTFGFTWGGLGYSQARWPEIVQLASITGVWGVSFAIVLVNVLLVESLARTDRRRYLFASLAAAVIVAMYLGGISSITRSRISAPDKQVALVQGGIEMAWRDSGLLDRIWRTYWPLTESIRGRVDFIVWPESALPDDLLSSPSLQREMSRLARAFDAHILTGGPHIVPDDRAEAGYREYNGAYLISPSGELAGEYFKVHLVPFGEFVPGRNWIPFIERYRVREVDYSPGKSHNTLRSESGDVGVMICFESIFPQIGRKITGDGAGMLFVITNDSWFGRTAAAAQHHDFSILRAVENRRYIARTATTGITSLIAPTGQVMGSISLGRSSVLTGRASFIRTKTFYTKYGDWFAVLCAAVGLISLLVCKTHSFLITKPRKHY
ncbi:MAG: apolipoprotein N-acyltransferase [Armatimonadetes bacterium]|nr:apolipoprotein N-acyltransferase [Armatimonadota bacterium]